MKHLRLAILITCALALPAQEPEIKAPPGYVLQRLDVTDGLIPRPSDWFYAHHGTPTGWVWTLTKQDTTKGPFETGLTIQMLAGLESRHKQDREAFCTGFIASKRKALKVFNECPVVDMGAFKRQCIEVLEVLPHGSGKRAFRILYSAVWMKKMDIAAITTFGAPEAEWEAVAPITQVMAEFRLIGPELGRKSAPEAAAGNPVP